MVFLNESDQFLKNLLELIFNDNELFQKMLLKCGINIKDEKTFKYIDDINTFSNGNDNNNYILHCLFSCGSHGRDSAYFEQFCQFLENSKKPDEFIIHKMIVEMD